MAISRRIRLFLGMVLALAGLLLVAWAGMVLLRDGVGDVPPTSTPIRERVVPTALPAETREKSPTPSAVKTPVTSAVKTPSAGASAQDERASSGEAPSPDAPSQGLYAPRERFCVGIPLPPPDEYPGFEELGLGWYLDWQARLHPSRPGNILYAQMVRVQSGGFRPDADTVRAIARANPGSLWLVGNEPDVIWQDNVTPQEYAAVYHEVYGLIKGADPTAQVAIGGVSQPTPLRLRYLDAVLQAYRERYGRDIPVDVWNVHNFVLREERNSWGVDIPPGFPDDVGILYEIEDNDDVEAFKAQLLSFRRWMKEHGLQNKPLIVSEYGVVMPEDYGFPFERVRDFMYATFDFFLTAADPELGYPADGYRLVQKWCWFSLADTKYPTGNLYDPETRQLTRLGEAWKAYVRRLE